ncbi:DUF3644 domain-containing protein [Acidovorax sp.]|uniref:DUF3644 domain-containing protein n=1 Tax=Acidovorax sp. TaxID=1872122 RepID=UPI002ACD40DB|nr:DUF3644 domain-containing protein [Acidovorax sp.]MDZ7863523.1 DUF3644 domain-containing protein [Acidovorax sp.]
MTTQRVRTVGSISNELIKKSREAALAAVQVFNNPAITFKSEIFVVLMIISWTYLLHAYFRKRGIEYRHNRVVGTRRKFDKTTKGAFKFWELERCLNDKDSPVEKPVATNLRFLIGLRHEIEHQMTTRLDERISARFQACCLNYNELIKRLFGDELGIDKHLAFSLQFSSISTDQIEGLKAASGLPAHIQAYIDQFDEKLTLDEYNDPKFAYRILFVQKLANHQSQADQVVEFIKSDSTLAKDINKSYAVIKDTEKAKYLPKQIVEKMQGKGYTEFKMHHHSDLWGKLNAKKSKPPLGVQLVNTWYWYEPWVTIVENHCTENSSKFKK